MTVGLAESVAIVTLNLCTIIVFMRNRNLRKRSTYLMINLAVIDMFVGGFPVYELFYLPGVDCNLWEWRLTEYGTYMIIVLLLRLFPIASLTNITTIALERMHATFFPFKHRVLKKWVYGLIIAVVWVTSALASVTYTLLVLFEEIQYLAYSTVLSICLLIICISYTSIVIKVRCGTQPQHHGAASRERKLTMTLLIVTVVSLLLYVPYAVFMFVFYISKSEIVLDNLYYAVVFLLFANSLVNPILYAIRMPEYRSAFLALFRRRAHQQRQVAVLPLRNM